MVAVGIAQGKTTAPVEITRLVRRGLRIVGSYGARTRADMPEIIRLAARGVFRQEGPSRGALRSTKPTPPTRRSTAARFSAGPS